MATLGVAARTGVSVSAVSRVLTNLPKSRVSSDTRQRILGAAPGAALPIQLARAKGSSHRRPRFSTSW